jgi:hypothetical protein
MTDGPRALHHAHRAAVELPPRWRVSEAHWKATANAAKQRG